MKKDDPGKTRKFIKLGIQFWIFNLIFYFVLKKMNVGTDGEVHFEYLEELLGILFVFGICGVPVILILSLILKVAERLIDKLS